VTIKLKRKKLRKLKWIRN